VAGAEADQPGDGGVLALGADVGDDLLQHGLRTAERLGGGGGRGEQTAGEQDGGATQD
jgi:hypothetical protein